MNQNFTKIVKCYQHDTKKKSVVDRLYSCQQYEPYNDCMNAESWFCFVFSLEELVKPEKNGLIFRDSEELAQQLQVRRIVNKITDFFLEKIYF